MTTTSTCIARRRDAKLVQKAKPTEPAAAASPRRELGKGSLERANADAAAKKAAAKEKHAAAAAAAAAAAPTAEEVAAAAARRDEAARAAAKEVDKRRTLERAAAAEAAEAKAAKSSTAAQLKGIAKLLAELELDKYAEAFAAAGYDDAKLKEVAEEVDDDRSEGGAGAAAVDAMIAAVGVKGGSAEAEATDDGSAWKGRRARRRRRRRRERRRRRRERRREGRRPWRQPARVGGAGGEGVEKPKK